MQAGAAVGGAAVFAVILSLEATDLDTRPGMTGRAEIHWEGRRCWGCLSAIQSQLLQTIVGAGIIIKLKERVFMNPIAIITKKRGDWTLSQSFTGMPERATAIKVDDVMGFTQ